MPPELCCCGDIHELSAEARLQYDAVMAFAPELEVRLTVAGVGTWIVPKFYIAVHGIKAEELPQLAELYQWPKVEGDGFGLEGGV